MASSSATREIDLDGLRQRNTPQQAQSSEEAKDAVLELNAEEMVQNQKGKEPRTFGRTPGGISQSLLPAITRRNHSNSANLSVPSLYRTADP